MGNDMCNPLATGWAAPTPTSSRGGFPQGAILAGLVIPVPARTAIWVTALIWTGTACLVNARRCNRTHCRYTGPYYPAMTAPVLALGLGLVSAVLYAWLILGCVIPLGSKLVWWATERARGKFS
jgi:hypothetical protein